MVGTVRAAECDSRLFDRLQAVWRVGRIAGRALLSARGAADPDRALLHSRLGDGIFHAAIGLLGGAAGAKWRPGQRNRTWPEYWRSHGLPCDDGNPGHTSSAGNCAAPVDQPAMARRS